MDPLRRGILLCAIACTASSCGGVTDPSPIAGTWFATAFVIGANTSQPQDVLAVGGSITIAISSKNQTSGRLVNPVNGISPPQSLAGRAVLTDNVVHFETTENTILGAMDHFTISGNTMQASEILSGVQIDITLVRQ